KQNSRPSAPVLTVRDLTLQPAHGKPILDGVSFEVRSGEILAVAGVEGNGQTELIEILAGLRRPSSGEARVGDRAVTNLDPYKIKRLGVAHIPEDRHRRGLLLPFDLAENSILGVHRDRPISGPLLLNPGVINERAGRLVAEYDVRPPDIRLPARALSGGNQQKLIVAREFDSGPKLLLVAQPTRGVDIGAIEFIHQRIIQLRDAGAAVLLISAELDEVLSLGDRIIVIYEGKIVGEVDPRTVTEEQIGLMMTGGKRAPEAAPTNTTEPDGE
ncbi:MAG TPA: ATP-binding cassette domain-containing protein, partial [Blastocatellia bacterium]|nr:ATP-binding cassette domain-containing protein [Blastocatellia bacterium]